MLLRSLVENGGYDESDFCRRLDEELFPLLDGTSDERTRRLHQPVDPRSVAPPRGREKIVARNRWPRRYDRSSGARPGAGGALCAKSPAKVAQTVSANCLLTQADEAIVAMTTAYCCVLALLVQRRETRSALVGQTDGSGQRWNTAFSRGHERQPSAAQTGRSRAAPGGTLLIARRLADPVLHGRSGVRSRHQDRARMEGLDRLRYALRDLSPASRRLLSGRSLSRRFRVGRCCMRSTAADKTRPAASSPAPSSARRLASVAFPAVSSKDWKTPPSSPHWRVPLENTPKVKSPRTLTGLTPRRPLRHEHQPTVDGHFPLALAQVWDDR